MSLDQIFEPIDLFLVDGDLVGGEDGITKDGGAQSHEEGFVCDLFAEVGGFLFVGAEVHFEILFVGFKLIICKEWCR